MTREEQQTYVLEQAEHVLRSMKVLDEDLKQTGRLAALEAIGSWKPAESQLQSWVSAKVRGAVRNERDQMRTGGIGSRRTVAAGSEVEHISMSDEAVTGEDDSETSTHQDSVTYQDTDCVPEGYGDAGREWQRITARQSFDALWRMLTEQEQILLGRLRAGISLEEHALWEQISRRAAYYQWDNLRIKIAHLQKTCDVHSTGGREAPPGFWNDAVSTVEGNPTWSQKTGKMWKDWSWKPKDSEE